MARCQIGDVGKADQVLRRLPGRSGTGFQQVADVIAEVDPLQRLADEPGRRVVENRHAVRAGVPRAVIEFVDLVTGLAAEQARQPDVAALHDMHSQVIGSRRHPAGVIHPRDPGQKSRRMHAGLAGETNQAARHFTVGLSGHQKHRVVQHPDQPVERFISHIAIMTQPARRFGRQCDYVASELLSPPPNRNCSTKALTSGGFSKPARWATPSSTRTDEPGMASAIAIASRGGNVTSSAPPTTSTGVVMVPNSARWSGRRGTTLFTAHETEATSTAFNAVRTCSMTSGRCRKVVGPRNAFSTGRFSSPPIPPVHFANASRIANCTFWRTLARPAVQFISTAPPVRSG